VLHTFRRHTVNHLETNHRAGDHRRRPQPTASLAHSGDPGLVQPDSLNLANVPILASFALTEELDTLRRERDGLQQGLFEAAQVQRRFSPPCQLRRGSLEISGEIFPVRHVSGDFLTAFDIGPKTVLGLGDIAGKGLSAGMWFAHMVGLIRIFAGSLGDPAKVAASINNHLTAFAPEPPLTTLFLASVDPKTSELTYCSAGHPAPLVLRQDGSVEWLGAGGPVMGAVPDAEFVNGNAVLNPGDTLLSYSDGLLECPNSRGAEFGLDRLVDATRGGRGSSANALLFSLLGAVRDFAAGEPRVDDLALMVVRRVAEI
jgi:serine phosphatase RsbU (regulator of sigma subunit)